MIIQRNCNKEINKTNKQSTFDTNKHANKQASNLNKQTSQANWS